MSLEKILRQRIKEGGPISVAAFMTLVLGHPEHGYYMKKDPFGRGGDFVTAPEISQMFGEVLGAWVADIWMQMGRPARFVLLECGPGRGTLMADMMRACSGVEGFHSACEIVLLEMSPVLREKQVEALLGHSPRWVSGLNDVPEKVPVIVIANEFLDALPVHQYEMTDQGWCERRISCNSDGLFCIAQAPLRGEFPSGRESVVAPVGDVMEFAPVREAFVKEVAGILERQGGAALFIDYGHLETAVGDTLQAVHQHEYCGVLEHIGDADLSSHVDFGGLKDIVPCRLTTQGEFLKRLGIEARAAYLAEKGDVEEIKAALRRLVDDDQMGKLFKVMGVRCDESIDLTGF